MQAYSCGSEVNSSNASNEFRFGAQGERGNDAAIIEAEESLNRAVISHGPGSEQTREVATHLVLAYNHFAMKKLSMNDIKVRFYVKLSSSVSYTRKIACISNHALVEYFRIRVPDGHTRNNSCNA